MLQKQTIVMVVFLIWIKVGLSYIADSKFLLSLEQQDALVNSSDRAQGARVSLETEGGPLCWKLLEGGELQRHLCGRYQGGEQIKPVYPYVSSLKCTHPSLHSQVALRS